MRAYLNAATARVVRVCVVADIVCMLDDLSLLVIDLFALFVAGQQDYCSE